MRRTKPLTVEISHELVAVLEDLARRNSTSVLVELKRSINDRVFFSDKVAQGARIILEKDSPHREATVVNWH